MPTATAAETATMWTVTIPLARRGGAYMMTRADSAEDAVSRLWNLHSDKVPFTFGYVSLREWREALRGAYASACA